jgi:serine/threonine protein kinase
MTESDKQPPRTSSEKTVSGDDPDTVAAPKTDNGAANELSVTPPLGLPEIQPGTGSPKTTPRSAFANVPPEFAQRLAEAEAEQTAKKNPRSSFSSLPAELATEQLTNQNPRSSLANLPAHLMPEPLTPRSTTNNQTPRQAADPLTPRNGADNLTPHGGHESTIPCPSCGLTFNNMILVCPNDGAALKRPPAARISLLNRFEFISEVGTGGVGVIYKARQKNTGNIVAIKMLSFEDVSKESKLRFQEEAKACSRLVHENLPKLMDYGLTEHGQPYMVLEFFEGADLAQVLRTAGGVALMTALDIAEQICSGLQYAHAQGVLHRDLKPSNIMIKWSEGEPIVKIVDFGIAKLIDEDENRPKLTKTGEVIGTPTYMSPEQIVGKDVDQRSDLYSVGCVLYELLAGSPPFVGSNSVQTILSQLNDKPVSMKEASRGRDFPEQLEQIIAKLLEKDPNDRYRHAGALKDDIHKIRDSLEKTPWTTSQEKAIVPSETSRRPRSTATTAEPTVSSASSPPPATPSNMRTILTAVIVMLTLAALIYTLTLRPAVNTSETRSAGSESTGTETDTKPAHDGASKSARESSAKSTHEAEAKAGHQAIHNQHVKPKQ